MKKTFSDDPLEKLFQKRAARKSHGIRFFLFFAITSLVLYFCTHIDLKNKQALTIDNSSSEVSASTVLYEPYINFFSYIVKPGDTFAGILSKFNIPENLATHYYSSLKSIGFSTLFPGDSLILTKDSNEKVKTFSLLNKLSYWYNLYQNDSTLQVERKPIEVTTYHCVVKGRLETSLSEDMWKYGVGDALVFKLSDLFAWDINFFIDPKKGDTFEVLFEKNYRDGHFLGYGSILAGKYVNSGKEYYAIGMKDAQGAMQYYDLHARSVQKQFLKAPLRFHRISSGFSYNRKHPILGIYRPHLGVDYAAPRGTPVYAAADGVVRFTGVNGNYGKQVKIAHGASYQTFYGHLQRIQRGIRPGIRVKQGQLIGIVGSTGLATGPHLDYRMKINSRFINPRTVSPPAKEGVPAEAMAQFEQIRQAYLSIIDMRATQNGCFVVDIIPPKTNKPVAVKTKSVPEQNNDDATGS